MVEIILGIIGIIMFVCYMLYTSETKEEIKSLEKAVDNWKNLYYEEKRRPHPSLEPVDNTNTDKNELYDLREKNYRLQTILNTKERTIAKLIQEKSIDAFSKKTGNMIYLSIDEVVIQKNFYDELLRYKKIYDDNKSKTTKLDLSQELHSLLLKNNSKIYLFANNIVAMYRDYYDGLVQYKAIYNDNKSKIISDLSKEISQSLFKNKSNVYSLDDSAVIIRRDYYDDLIQHKQLYNKNVSENNDNTWKDKYEELNRKYIKTHDEVIYLRRAYDKQNAQIVLLQQKNTDLKKKLSNRYTKDDILSIKRWEDFEKFVATRFKEQGYKTTLTSATNDGGKDIIVEKNSVKTYIECKYWQTGHSIGRELIQKLAGAAMMDGVKNAIFITTSSYHSNAYDAARALNSNGFNIQLWDTDKLLKFINS